MFNLISEKLFLDGKRPYYWLAGIIFALYFPILFFGLTKQDDEFLLANGQRLLADTQALSEVFSEDFFRNANLPYYRPVLALSFIPDAMLGASSFIAHFINIIIHIIAVWLLFSLFKKFNYGRQASLMAAVFFAVHPALVQAVAWIPGRNDPLMAVFIFSSLIFLINYLDRQKSKDYVWHIIFFALALFTKETALVIGPIFALFILLIKKTPVWSKEARRLLSGWFLATAALLGLRYLALNDMLYSASAFMGINNALTYIQYFGKIILPFNLSVAPIINNAGLIYGTISLALIGWLIALSRQIRFNYLLFGLAWYVIFLLPAAIAHNPQMNYDVQMEFRLYLPLAGFLFMLLEVNALKRLGAKKSYYLILYVLIIALFSAAAFRYNFAYADMTAYFENAVKHSPQLAYAHRDLGAAYYFSGRLDEAEREYKKTIEINPRELFIHNNLGVLYLSKNMFQEAEDEFKLELENFPYSDRAYANLGLLYYKQAKPEEAIKAFEKQLEYNPGQETARMLYILREQLKKK